MGGWVVAHEILLSSPGTGGTFYSLFSILFQGPRSQVPSPKSQVPSPKSQVPSPSPSPSPSRLTILKEFFVKLRSSSGEDNNNNNSVFFTVINPTWGKVYWWQTDNNYFSFWEKIRWGSGKLQKFFGYTRTIVQNFFGYTRTIVLLVKGYKWKKSGYMVLTKIRGKIPKFDTSSEFWHVT